MEGCGKSAKAPTDKCQAHGGGRRCQYEGCNRGAEGPLCTYFLVEGADAAESPDVSAEPGAFELLHRSWWGAVVRSPAARSLQCMALANSVQLTETLSSKMLPHTACQAAPPTQPTSDSSPEGTRAGVEGRVYINQINPP